ncbi:uncharacterized protein B0H18DRAFT_1205420 [Fomitopsis serialis]|uniref:uncharacterized protein n=1 Tax=Fomitopsis serialis TaxID=139415 RepID=UPI002007D45C|nr:uncharacterized protein B0H18DRAFT_1205420 [Neoantrodia serialis]KAH9938130.1 hypothetical protein B0H18DRAFT_1205420 [Neoantrodia serialis]
MSELSYVDAEEIASACKSADFGQSQTNSRYRPTACYYANDEVVHKVDLPAELLANIISYIAEEDKEGFWWKSISRVSRYWHEVAREAACLWTTPYACYGPNLFRAAMERSRNLPLTVHIVGPHSWCLAALEAVRPHAHRVQSLFFFPGYRHFANSPPSGVLDMSCLEFDVPNLTALWINLKYFTEQTPFIITHSRYPHLCELTLERATTPCDPEAYASLTRLTLLDQHDIEGFEETLEDFSAMLRACTNLQFLCLEESGPDVRDDADQRVRPADPQTTPRLPHLRSLWLRDDEKNTAFFMRHLAFPPTTCIYLTMMFSGSLPSQELEGFYVSPSVEGVISQIEVIRVVANLDLRIRVEFLPNWEARKTFEWGSVDEPSCIAFEHEGRETGGSLEVEWCIWAFTQSARMKFVAAPLRYLIIAGEFWDATGSLTWKRLFDVFPSIEVIQIEDYERQDRTIYRSLSMIDPRTNQIACPNLKTFVVKGRWSPTLLSDVRECFATRKSHVPMLEKLVFKTNTRTIGLPLGPQRFGYLSGLREVAKVIELWTGKLDWLGGKRDVVRVEKMDQDEWERVLKFDSPYPDIHGF